VEVIECPNCRRPVRLSTVRRPPSFVARDDNGIRVFQILDENWLVHQCVNADIEAGAASADGMTARTWRAAGMVSIQADCGFDDALALMRDHATRAGLTLHEIASRVVTRRIRFRPGAGTPGMACEDGPANGTAHRAAGAAGTIDQPVA